jgi:hypothetical protein
MLKRVIALFAVVGAVTLAGAVPSGAQQAAELTAVVECTEPGTFTITWTIETFIGTPGEVTEAVLSGAAEGDITDSFAPNPFEFDDDFIVGSSEVSGDTVGPVTLDITIIYQSKGPFDFDDSATVTLDGSCEAPPTTEESTTTTAAPAAAAATQPRFTG